MQLKSSESNFILNARSPKLLIRFGGLLRKNYTAYTHFATSDMPKRYTKRSSTRAPFLTNNKNPLI